MLERWTTLAKKGRLVFVALVGSEGPAVMQAEFTGMSGMEFAVNYGLDSLKKRIVNTIELREPPGNDAQGADRVCYNLNSAPMNWDFVIWLVDQEMTRRREGAPPPLKVGFYRSETNDYRASSYSDVMLNRVMRPLLPLIGAVEDDRAIKGRLKQVYAPREICNAARDGESVPILRPSDMARSAIAAFLKDSVPPVTITLREAGHFTWRNSDIPAWVELAHHIKRCGHKVIFVRDTARADEPMPDGFRICPEASKSVDKRMALYEKAYANLFVSNGPQGLALFSDRPFLSFHQLKEDDAYEANRPAWWAEHMGIKEGEQFPWLDRTQRFVYKPDTFENLLEEWETLETQISDATTGAYSKSITRSEGNGLCL